MIAGHFGFAAMVKSREPTAPLWGLMLATVWLDVVFIPLLLTHVESVQPLHPGYGGLIIHADYTHSVVGMILISSVLGLAFLPRWGQRVAAVIALVAMSHWVLDLVVHRPDMPSCREMWATYRDSASVFGSSPGSRHCWSSRWSLRGRSCTGARPTRSQSRREGQAPGRPYAPG